MKRLSPLSVTDAYNITAFGAKGDGITDDTISIQTSLDAAGAAGGGIVFVPAKTFISSNLTVHGNTTIMGSGWRSLIKAKSGTTGTFLGLATPSSDVGVVICNIRVDANNQSGLSGVYFDNTGVAQDSLHRLTNLWVYNAPVDGIHLGPAVIETNLISCYTYNSGRYGFNFDVGATDNRIMACTTGLSANHGFYVQGNNNHFMGSKAYYSGYTGSTWTAGTHGFMLYPSASQDLHDVSLVSCEAQNNAANGFHVDGSASGATVQHVSLANCIADGNNEVGGTQYGVYLNNVRYSAINGTTTRSQSGAAHTYGLAVFGNCTGTQIGANDFNGSTGPVYIDSGASGLYSSASALPLSSLPGGAEGGVDAPFTNVTRIIGNHAMQVVTSNGAFDAYISNGTTQNNVWSLYYDHMDMHSFPIQNVPDPTNAQDASTKHYVDNASTVYHPSGTDVTVADGGTGASTASGARTSLGLVIGTDVEAHDADLTTIAGLTPTNDDVIQRKSGAWTNRTMAQVKTDLALVKADVGLGSVDNTSDATKNAATATLTNKRVTKRSGTVASSATPTINTDNIDIYTITALAVAITSLTSGLSGTPNIGDEILLGFKDNGTPRAITHGASFVGSGVASLLTTTVAGKQHWEKLMWDGAHFVCLAVDAVGY